MLQIFLVLILDTSELQRRQRAFVVAFFNRLWLFFWGGVALYKTVQELYKFAKTKDV